MKLKSAFASMLAVAILMPSVGFAQGAIINTTRSNIKHPSITINPNDPKTIQACKDAGGTVAMENNKPVCMVATSGAEAPKK